MVEWRSRQQILSSVWGITDVSASVHVVEDVLLLRAAAVVVALVVLVLVVFAPTCYAAAADDATAVATSIAVSKNDAIATKNNIKDPLFMLLLPLLK